MYDAQAVQNTYMYQIFLYVWVSKPETISTSRHILNKSQKRYTWVIYLQTEISQKIKRKLHM